MTMPNRLSRRPSAGEYVEEASGRMRQAADARAGRVGPSRKGASDLGCMAPLRTHPLGAPRAFRGAPLRHLIPTPAVGRQ